MVLFRNLMNIATDENKAINSMYKKPYLSLGRRRASLTCDTAVYGGVLESSCVKLLFITFPWAEEEHPGHVTQPCTVVCASLPDEGHSSSLSHLNKARIRNF